MLPLLAIKMNILNPDLDHHSAGLENAFPWNITNTYTTSIYQEPAVMRE